MQRTPDTVRSIDDCTTAFKPRCLVQSSSENDKNRPLRQLSNKPPFIGPFKTLTALAKQALQTIPQARGVDDPAAPNNLGGRHLLLWMVGKVGSGCIK